MLILLLASFVFAGSRPDWTIKPPRVDGQYAYYVGRSTRASSEADAISFATNDAYRQALSENFGTSVQIQSQTFETGKTVSMVARTSEKSRSVKFEGFEQTDVHIEQRDTLFEAWVLYRFPLAAIRAEQARLKALPELDEAIEFSISGKESTVNSGAVEVVTDPEGAAVYVDGEVYGKSPLKIFGQLTTGQHQIRIDHPNFEEVVEDFVYIPGKTIRLERLLIRSSGVLNISTEPSNANIVIDGVPVGISPIQNLKIESGTKVKMEITHGETEKMVQEVSVEKNTSRNLNLNLTYKPSFLSFNTSPSDATVKINGESYTTPLQKVFLPVGHHKILIEKEGYLPEKLELEIRGGEKKTLDTVHLMAISEEQKRRELFPWIIGFSFTYLKSPVDLSSFINKDKVSSLGISLSLEKKFRYAGLKFIYELSSYDHQFANSGADIDERFGKFGNANSTEYQLKKIKTTAYTLATPFYWNSWYLSPEVGIGSVQIEQIVRNFDGIGFSSSGAVQNLSLPITFTGAHLGYHRYAEPGGWSWFVEGSVRSYRIPDLNQTGTMPAIRAGVLVRW